MYIYRERERERERDAGQNISGLADVIAAFADVCMLVCTLL